MSVSVKERPVQFTWWETVGLLAGRKTVMRRMVKGVQIPTEDTSIPAGERQRWSAIAQIDPRYGFSVFGATDVECAKELAEFAPCPYGRRGERLWVRETWVADAQLNDVSPKALSRGEPILYRADGALRQTGCSMIAPGKTRPSIHMPRWACRVVLAINDVRVERLQDITEEQAQAEGYKAVRGGMSARNLMAATHPDWDANPWVWVIAFKKVQP